MTMVPSSTIVVPYAPPETVPNVGVTEATMSHIEVDPGVLLAAFEQASDSIVITDAYRSHGGPHVVRCNEAFSRMTGYAEHEIVGRNLRLLQGPDTDPAVIDRLRQCLADGSVFEGETVKYRKDGTPY